MAYTSIRTAHSVGDVVYFHDEESDTVQRGVVVGVEARNIQPGYSPKWTVLYQVAHKFASEPPKHPSLISESDLHSRPEYAFPAPPEVDAAESQAVAEAA